MQEVRNKILDRNRKSQMDFIPFHVSDFSFQTGFTLIELILVMLILCTVLGMAGPSLRGFFSQRQMDDTAACMLSLTQFAQSQAVCEARHYRVNIDIDDRTYWLTVKDKGVFRKLKTSWGRIFILPPEITVKVWDLERDGSLRLIEFSPEGRTTPGAIQFVGPRGDTRQLICRSATEGFAILDDKAWTYETNL